MVVKLLRPWEHNSSFLIADISVHWFSQALRCQETSAWLGRVRDRLPEGLRSERLRPSWGTYPRAAIKGR